LTVRDSYPYDEAVNDLEIFFKKNIKDAGALDDLLNYLDKCRQSQSVSFRYIHERLMRYRKDFSDYFEYTEDEDRMIDALFYFWS